MSGYPVTQISLDAIPGVHNGTGTWHDSLWVVVPDSVPPPGQLAFVGQPLQVTTMLFAIADNVVPNWFGVAVPAGITEFGNAHIFFHPTPGQAQYVDSDYPAKKGKWPELFYYMERLGYQLDGAARDQVLIMPFLTEAAKDAGILPGHWQQISTDILTAVRDTVTGAVGPPVEAASVVVSSYSAGIIYSDSFRRLAAGLSPLLAEVWDLDGNISSYHAISQALRTSAGRRVIQYDQIPSNDHTSFHVPLPRWAGYVAPPTNAAQVHGLIRDFMFLHGASISGVGGTIEVPGTGTAPPIQPSPASAPGPAPAPAPPQPAVTPSVPVPSSPVPSSPVPSVPVPSVPVPAVPVPAVPVPAVPMPAVPVPAPPVPVCPTPVPPGPAGSGPVPPAPVSPVPVPALPTLPAPAVPPRAPVPVGAPPVCPPPGQWAPPTRPQQLSGCGCCAAVSAEVAVVALTAVQAIAALAAQHAARAGNRPGKPGTGNWS